VMLALAIVVGAVIWIIAVVRLMRAPVEIERKPAHRPDRD
jgi:hypothetical protein